MANRVEFDNGSMASADCLADFSFDLFQTTEHLENCEHVAREFGFAGDHFKVAVNFLFLKSLRLRKLTALRWLIWNSGRQVRRVIVDRDFCVRHFAPIAAGPEIVEDLGEPGDVDVTFKQAVTFALKVVTHRAFRLLSWRSSHRKNVMRAWVDVTLAMYPRAAEDRHFFVYPFPINPSRQIQFVRDLVKAGCHWSFAGLPYSLTGLWLPFLSPQNRLRRMVELETSAYAAHAVEFQRMGVRSVQTSDEFEVGGVALFEGLRARGISSVNSAHGVGNYCPYVYYDEFRVICDKQAEFYRLRSSVGKLVLREQANTVLQNASFSRKKLDTPTLVFIHQNFSALGLFFEDRAQMRAMQTVRAVAEKHRWSAIIKAHPNTRDRELLNLSDSTKIPVQRRLDWSLIRPIFVTLNSTAYFDFRVLGPFLFFVEKSLQPAVYFGDAIHMATAESLEKNILELLSENDLSSDVVDSGQT